MSGSRWIWFLILVFLVSGCVGFYRWLQSANPSDELLRRQRIEESLVLIRNQGEVLPLRELDSTRIALLSLSKRPLTAFGKTLELYAPLTPFWLPHQANDSTAKALLEQLRGFDYLIIGLEPEQKSSEQLPRIPQNTLRVLRTLAQDSMSVIFTHFASSDLLRDQPLPLGGFDAALLAHNSDSLTQTLAAQLIFGGISAQGRLRTTINKTYYEGFGLDTSPQIRLKYSIPEEVGINRQKLRAIDSIVWEAIQEGATPGCQVLVARYGRVFFHRAYGHHTYAQKRPVRLTDLYDLASITKITSALPVFMRWHGEGKFPLDKTLGDYLPALQGTNKAELGIREVLSHHAGLQPYLVYWQEDEREGKLAPYLSTSPKAGFELQVTDQLFISPKYYPERIVERIARSSLRSKKGYKYSGLAFLLWPEIVASQSGMSYENYLRQTFYNPLGAYRLGFLPRRYFSKEEIVPTEQDQGFRKQQLHGFVHDDAAAMLGGLSANAGLFSNANDLAKLLQMYLWEGQYGGRRYIAAESLKAFTSRHFAQEDNRRGLGFDKPFLEEPSITGNAAPSASQTSYGHSGYTGTFAWLDPEYQLLYIFLSNRVYPTRENTKLFKLNTRTRIQEAIYQALE